MTSLQNLSADDLEQSPKHVHKLVQEVAKLLADYLADAHAIDNEKPLAQLHDNERVIHYETPEEVSARLDLSLPEHSNLNLAQVVEWCNEALATSVNVSHPHFYNQLFARPDVIALVAELTSIVLNVSMYTFELGSVFTLMERKVVALLGDALGWRTIEGIGTPGGSNANLYGLQLARLAAFPEGRTKGFAHAGELCVLSSRHAHYCITKNAGITGLGTDAVIMVDVDERGRMRPDALRAAYEQAIADGKRPFMVNATAGSTVLGAFDPIDELADFCDETGLWLHVDGALGGMVLFSKESRHMLNGIERAKSFVWNPHKGAGMPLQTSFFFTTEIGALHNANACHAPYLFQKDKQLYDCAEYDTGDQSHQCGRKQDIFKLFLTLKARGTIGLAERIDLAMSNARRMAAMVQQRKAFRLRNDPEYVQVCFWYMPRSMRDQSQPNNNPDTMSHEKKKQFNEIAIRIKEKMVLDGTLMTGVQLLDDSPNFFRMVLVAPCSNDKSMTAVLDEIERCAGELGFDDWTSSAK